MLADARLSRDFARFKRFADGWVRGRPASPTSSAMRANSSTTERFEPVWGIRFTSGSDVPIEWVDRSRQRRVYLRALWTKLLGADPRYRPIAPVRQAISGLHV